MTAAAHTLETGGPARLVADGRGGERVRSRPWR